MNGATAVPVPNAEVKPSRTHGTTRGGKGVSQHLLAKGKFKMQALVAVMRKLLHALHAMFKTRQPYDGSKLFRLKSASTQEAPRVLVAS